MAIYLKFGNVKGNATAEGFAGQIVVTSINFGYHRNVTMEAGNLSNRETSKPTLSLVQITKKADNSVAALFKEGLTGAAGQDAVLTFVRTGDKLQEYMAYKLSNCIIKGKQILKEEG